MKYYIQNVHAGFLGNSIFFWAIDGRGYTAKIDNAEKFDFDRAKKICSDNPEKFKAWPVGYIDNNHGTQRVTDCQYLDNDAIIKF